MDIASGIRLQKQFKERKMSRKFFALAALAVVLVWLIGCVGYEPGRERVPPVTLPVTEPVMYYGADLSPFPPNVREWIMNRAFPPERIEREFMIDPQLRVWWGDDNNSVLAEASFIMAEGYADAGTRQTFGQGARYSASSEIFAVYGEYAKYHTLRYKWELRQEVDRLLATDPAYAEIIAFAKQLSSEIEYDWANFSAYRGPVQRNPNQRYAVCEGYANEVMDKVLALSSVQSVERWTSPGHAWNVLNLVDGRKLYFDLTWFDNEYINEETGEIYQTDDYDWENITFNEDLFRHSNIGYGTRVFHHDIGEFDSVVMR
jgi:hypothetical protein